MKIEIDDLSRPQIHALLNEHLRNMYELSPPESVHALDLERLRRPVEVESEPLGCGGRSPASRGLPRADLLLGPLDLLHDPGEGERLLRHPLLRRDAAQTPVLVRRQPDRGSLGAVCEAHGWRRLLYVCSVMDRCFVF